MNGQDSGEPTIALEKIVESIDQSPCIFIIPRKAHHVFPVLIRLLTYLLGTAKKKGLYISCNKSAKFVFDSMESQHLPTAGLQIVDCVTKPPKEKLNKPVAYLAKRGSLVELSLVIQNHLKAQDIDFIVLDTACDLFEFDQFETVERFLSFLSQKLEAYLIHGFYAVTLDEMGRLTADAIDRTSRRTAKV